MNKAVLLHKNECNKLEIIGIGDIHVIAGDYLKAISMFPTQTWLVGYLGLLDGELEHFGTDYGYKNG